MYAAVSGYYDGNHIVMNEAMDLSVGQEVIITILDTKKSRKKNIDLNKYAGRGRKMFDGNADEFIKELRDSDRL
ncbi:hypothetical protein [Ruminococcus sp. HUN007]|jgi:hypothetical protein|uniref:hypothetical protein n=1 Tax=Ruminococcus sp. HUN007 TaxID=1514668 RepID=UPI0005D1F9F6|nr:hypothetical protein [Ruminococcus sp. HUN007]